MIRRLLCWLWLCPLEWGTWYPPEPGAYPYLVIGRCPHCGREVAERPDGSRVL